VIFVFDTNVIVRALLSPKGTRARVVGLAVTGTVSIVVTLAIIAEYRRAAEYPKIQALLGDRSGSVRVFLDDVERIALLVESEEGADLIPADPYDNIFIETALAGNAQLIVTGNACLLDFSSHQGIDIVRPSALLSLLSGNR
jgi:uncharacterized protein